jgi:hypothetical protein
MKYLLNKISLTAFNLIALKKGYRFLKVSSPQELEDAYTVCSEEAFSFPKELQDKISAYKAGTINFVAYYKNTPVGMVRLADPGIINRPYELYGVDAAGEHYEIQSLVVRKDFREGTQFVMLGLFKAMYCYSIKHDILSWSSCGARNVYLTMRRLCKKIDVEQVDFAAINNPVTKYLLAHNIIETYFTMQVVAFEPWSILKRFVKQLVKKWEAPAFLNIKRLAYDSFNYGCK